MADIRTLRSYAEFMTVFAKTVAERTRPGQRQDVEEQGTDADSLKVPGGGAICSGNECPSGRATRAQRLGRESAGKLTTAIPTLADLTFHAYGRSEGICGIIISDQEYPGLVAHQVLSKIVDEFLTQHPRTEWANTNATIVVPQLKEYLTKYQDPHQADSILKIQKELDETKIVLHKTIESVLQRGEKIDDLVAKSDGLSAQSKMFYRESTRPVRMPAKYAGRGTMGTRANVASLQNKPRSRTLAVSSCNGGARQ